MKFNPFSTVPAGTLDAILATGLTLSDPPAGDFGDVVSGVLKGCAAEVEVAAGLSFGRGFVVCVVLRVTASARVEEV
jgi:hypothetical protein